MATPKVQEGKPEDSEFEEFKVKIDFKFKAEGELKEMAREMGEARRNARCESLEDALAQLREHGVLISGTKSCSP